MHPTCPQEVIEAHLTITHQNQPGLTAIRPGFLSSNNLAGVQTPEINHCIAGHILQQRYAGREHQCIRALDIELRDAQDANDFI